MKTLKYRVAAVLLAAVIFTLLPGVAVALPTFAATHSVARQWDEELLNAIRRDTARPPVHARNLYHLSVAMWDGWAVYDQVAKPVLTNEKVTAANVEAARAETISFAAYRIISTRFLTSVGHVATQLALDGRMSALGYDKDFTSTEGATPAALGNRIAANVLNYGLQDGSNEQGNYVPTNGYKPVNAPLPVAVAPPPGVSGNPNLVDPNRWQPLALAAFRDQNGNVTLGKYPDFVCPHWDAVKPFALTTEERTHVFLDPGSMPLYMGEGDAIFRKEAVDVVRYSSQLTPDDGVLIDISPGVFGNNTLGTNDGKGRSLNPVTGLPYAPNVVKRGDFARVLSEFFADGPNSETPPGHWNTIANYTTDNLTVKRIGGTGPVVNDLEWDVKMYLTINGAVHDAAIACWGAKGYYDSIRPISSIRYMAGLGQSSDPNGPSYHAGGIPLVPGLIEVVTDASAAPGQRHASLSRFKGEIVIKTWIGNPFDPTFEYSGVSWIRASVWVPYQTNTFVTPPFAGYYSGHSTYSRSAAESLAKFTGSEYFPGGLGTFVAEKEMFLRVELGPSQTVTLQWATFYDAADQAGLSRLFGGIHVPVDDFTGRVTGSKIGRKAFERAVQYFNGN